MRRRLDVYLDRTGVREAWQVGKEFGDGEQVEVWKRGNVKGGCFGDSRPGKFFL